MILACGAIPLVRRIDGIDRDNVYLANDILAFRTRLENQRILVLGAGLVGAEPAEVLAFGSKADIVLYDEFRDKTHIYRVGDGRKAADAKKAIYDAAELAMEL